MADMPRSVYIGFDQREAAAFAVAVHSAKRRLTQPIPVHGLVLSSLQHDGIYIRPTERRGSLLWDTISSAPMSTEHAIARFAVGMLGRSGWVLFMDGDVLVRASLARLFDELDPDKAIYCVQHPPMRQDTSPVKMDAQAQLGYPRKWWSSVFVLNAEHPKNAALNHHLLNSVPGRDLHRFCWLADEDIGALDPMWNYLIGVSDPAIEADAKIAHFTLGTPDMPGHARCEFADEWRKELVAWASK